MKQTVEWHKGCLDRRQDSLKYKIAKLQELQSEVEKDTQDLALYQAQIDLASKENKDSFDRDKYGLKRLIGV